MADHHYLLRRSDAAALQPENLAAQQTENPGQPLTFVNAQGDEIPPSRRAGADAKTRRLRGMHMPTAYAEGTATDNTDIRLTSASPSTRRRYLPKSEIAARSERHR